MDKKMKSLLFGALGIVAAVLVYVCAVTPFNEDTAALETENATYRQKVEELEALELNIDYYTEETETLNTLAAEIADRFYEDILPEVEIMEYYEAEVALNPELAISTITMSEDRTGFTYSNSSVIESGSATMAVVDTTDDTTDTEDGEETTTESTTAELYQAETTINFETTYNGLKAFLNYLYDTGTRKEITEVSLSSSEGGYVNGSISVTFYYFQGADYDPETYEHITISGIDLGIDQIFSATTGTIGTDTSSDTTSDTSSTTTSETVTKTTEELAQEVLSGFWGNGEIRKQRLIDAGYDYVTIQARVNQICAERGIVDPGAIED